MSTATLDAPAAYRCIDLAGEDVPRVVTVGGSDYVPVSLYLTYQDGVVTKVSLEGAILIGGRADLEHTRTVRYAADEDWVQRLADKNRP